MVHGEEKTAPGIAPMSATGDAITELRQAGVRRIRLIDFFRMYRLDGDNLSEYVHNHPGELSFAILDGS
jgi:hypothetical protein